MKTDNGSLLYYALRGVISIDLLKDVLNQYSVQDNEWDHFLGFSLAIQQTYVSKLLVTLFVCPSIFG